VQEGSDEASPVGERAAIVDSAEAWPEDAVSTGEIDSLYLVAARYDSFGEANEKGRRQALQEQKDPWSSATDQHHPHRT